MLLTLAGPSETHVVTATTLGPRPEDWAPLPSIGLPIDDTACYVLVHGEPVERQSLDLVAMGGACLPAAATAAPLAPGRWPRGCLLHADRRVRPGLCGAKTARWRLFVCF